MAKRKSTPINVQLPDGSYGVFYDIDEDLTTFHWGLAGGNHAYLSRTKGKGHVYAHRTVMIRKLGRELRSSEQVDHINGNTRDNQRSNLRLATHQQNSFNRRKPRTNTSGYKGVQFRYGHYYAHIKVNRKMIHLGTFETAEDAHHAYCDAAREYFGEFARME